MKGNNNLIKNVIRAMLIAFIASLACKNILVYSDSFRQIDVDVKKALCEACVGKITVAIYDYEKWHSINFVQGPHIPKSLHDEVFVDKFLNGELTSHPFGEEWDDFYDSSRGSIDKDLACGILPSKEKEQLKKQFKDRLEQKIEEKKKEVIYSVSGIIRNISQKNITIEKRNCRTDESKIVEVPRDPFCDEMINQLHVGDKIEIEYEMKNGKVQFNNLQLISRIPMK